MNKYIKENWDFILLFPILYIGLFFNSLSIIGGVITGLLALIYICHIIKKEFRKSLVNILIFISIYVLMFNNRIMIEPILKVIVIIILLCDFKSNIMKYITINASINFLLNLYYYYRNNNTIDIENLITTTIIICFILYRYKKNIIKWQLKNLNFNNNFFKSIHYFFISILYFNNAILIKNSNLINHYNVVPIINGKTIIISIIIFYITYIIIFPIIKKNTQ